jgi:sugar phosphate isomerase/epimerase
MLREILDLGFDRVELSHGTRISLQPGITEMVDAGEIRVTSLHNFCPLPLGVNKAAPNLYKFSSPDSRERDLALKYTRKTIEFAVRLKARVVVLHLGSVPMPRQNARLEKLIASGKRHTDEYLDLCARISAKREAHKQKFLKNVISLLEQIVPEATEHGLILGFENRDGLHEFPFDSDFPSVLQEFPGDNVIYWHDTGHAQIKENLGFLHHYTHLESLQDRLGGFHVHDVQVPGKDHCAPGSGMLDFAALKPLVKPHHLKVLELSPGLTAEQVKAGYAHIRSIWGPE